MLKRLEQNETEKLQAELLKEPVYNLRVSALIDAYGVNQSFFNVWHDDFKSVVAALDSSYYICENEIMNIGEIKDFLSFSPGVLQISGKKESIEKLGISYDKRSDYYVLVNESTKAFRNIETDKEPKLKEIYELIAESGSDDLTLGSFNEWYADMSHRIRHGCARAYSIKENGQIISALLVSALSEKAGLISGVVTKKDYRGKGLAAALLSKAYTQLKEEGRTAVTECSNNLYGFYENAGFKAIGEYTIIE